MANPILVSGVSTPGKWRKIYTANPLALLHPYLSSEGAVVFKSARAWECVSAKQFDKIARISMVYLALVEQVGNLNFMHRSARGGQAHEAKFVGSQEFLNELKAAHPQIFAKPVYPITENHAPFTIPLIDPSV